MTNKKQKSLNHYSRCKDAKSLYRAVELAYELGKYQSARNLLEKVKGAIRERLEITRDRVHELSIRGDGGGGTSALMAYYGAQDVKRDYVKKISAMEVKLAQKLR